MCATMLISRTEVEAEEQGGVRGGRGGGKEETEGETSSVAKSF